MRVARRHEPMPNVAPEQGAWKHMVDERGALLKEVDRAAVAAALTRKKEERPIINDKEQA